MKMTVEEMLKNHLAVQDVKVNFLENVLFSDESFLTFKISKERQIEFSVERECDDNFTIKQLETNKQPIEYKTADVNDVIDFIDHIGREIGTYYIYKKTSFTGKKIGIYL